MAYTIDLDKTCTERDCDRRATVMVRDNRNGDIRECCKRHGELLALKLTEEGR